MRMREIGLAMEMEKMGIENEKESKRGLRVSPRNFNDKVNQPSLPSGNPEDHPGAPEVSTKSNWEPTGKQSAKHIAGNQQVNSSIYFLLRFTE